jgi:tRNA U54 and U55 pseudouridine synthase Pus10
MIKNEYNGWTNKQTWNVNLTYGEVFTSMCEDQEFDDVDHLADAFETLVDELEFENLKCGTLAHQAVSEYLNEVDWNEIAKHYAQDFDLFQEEEEESELA